MPRKPVPPPAPKKPGRKAAPKKAAAKAPPAPPPPRKPHVKRRPSRLNSPSIDWESIRLRYVSGPPETQPGRLPALETLEQVAAALGMKPDTIEKKCAAEGWVEQRARWRRELSAKVESETNERLAHQHVEARVAFHGFALAGLTKAAQKLRSEQLSPSDLRSTMAAGREAQKIAEVAMGRPADGPQQVALAWVELNRLPSPEQRKAIAMALDDDDAGAIEGEVVSGGGR